MIGLALSGGGSRAIAFHLGCLRALDDLGILEKIGVISTISGGSIIGAYYAYTPDKPFDEFESDIRSHLRQGFQKKIVFELLKPNSFFPCLGSWAGSKAFALIGATTPWRPELKRRVSRTDIFRKVLDRELFAGLAMNTPRRNNVQVVIGACELRTGSAFRFGTEKIGGWRHGEVSAGEIDVAFAAAASAAYPIFLPPLDRTWNFRKGDHETQKRILLTDGGVYDNLGIQPLEPDRDSRFSLHTYPCDYLIVCNAGFGQDSGESLPTMFFPRIKKTFGVVHRRVQDSAMHRLHHMQKAGSIKGFVLPYLGQQDDALPWKPSVLTTRDEVMGYPTDFAAMPDHWIERLSNRGEQLTRILVSLYLSNILS